MTVGAYPPAPTPLTKRVRCFHKTPASRLVPGSRTRVLRSGLTEATGQIFAGFRLRFRWHHHRHGSLAVQIKTLGYVKAAAAGDLHAYRNQCYRQNSTQPCAGTRLGLEWP